MPLFFHNLRGGPVEVYRWILPIRAVQLVLAVIVLGLTSYVLSIDNHGPVHPALVPALIISILTLLPILPLTTPLIPLQRRLYDPRIALVADLFATLFWLAAFVALAAYLYVFRSSYASDGISTMRVWNHVAYDTVDKSGLSWRSWQCGVAASVFGALEFLLFTLTTLIFLYCYHLSLSGVSLYGANSRDSFLDPAADVAGMTGTITPPTSQPPTTASLALVSGADPELGLARPIIPSPEPEPATKELPVNGGPAMGLALMPTPTASMPTPTPAADEDVKVHHPGKEIDEQLLKELPSLNPNVTVARHESMVLGEKFDGGLVGNDRID